jgi:hypothetical protein
MTRLRKLLEQRHTKVYVPLAILCGILSAVSTAVDNFILHSVTVSSTNRVVGPLVYMLSAYSIGLLLTLVYCQLTGRFIDKRFTRLTFESFKTQKWAFIAGAVSSLETLALFIGSTFVDVSIVLPLTSLYIVYLALYDVLRRTIGPKVILLPAVLVIIGAAGTSIAKVGIFEVSVAALIFIVIFDQGMTAIIEITYQQGVSTTNAVNFHFWRFLWSAITAIICILIWAVLTNGFPIFIAVLQIGLLSLLVLIPVRIFLLFLGQILRGRAYKSGGPVSEIAVLSSIRVMLGVPITLLVSSIIPQAFGNINGDWRIWIIRSVSALLIFISIGLVYRRHNLEVLSNNSNDPLEGRD